MDRLIDSIEKIKCLPSSSSRQKIDFFLFVLHYLPLLQSFPPVASVHLICHLNARHFFTSFFLPHVPLPHCLIMNVLLFPSKTFFSQSLLFLFVSFPL